MEEKSDSAYMEVENPIIDVKKLKNSAQQRKELVVEIVNIAEKINDEIVVFHSRGGVKMSYELPMNFEIINMTNQDAQNMIYSKVVKFLDDSGYDVYMTAEQDSYILYICWQSPFEIKAKAERVKYLQSKTRKPVTGKSRRKNNESKKH
jgi:hypothetical protein